MDTSRQGILYIVIYPTTAHKPKFQLNSLSKKANSYQLLITGGTDRELDYACWAIEIKKRIPRDNLIFLEGGVTDKMVRELSDRVRPSQVKESFRDCFASVLERSGQLSKATIVFSPRTRSFEKFDNEIDRGRMFNDVVKKELIK